MSGISQKLFPYPLIYFFKEQEIHCNNKKILISRVMVNVDPLGPRPRVSAVIANCRGTHTSMHVFKHWTKE